MTAADEAYDRLHGVDGHVQAPAGLTESDLNDLYPRWMQKVSFTHLTAAIERILDDHMERAIADASRLSELGQEWQARALVNAGKVAMVAGLLAAYGDAEGTPVDYEFLVHQISEAIK